MSYKTGKSQRNKKNKYNVITIKSVLAGRVIGVTRKAPDFGKS